VLTRGTVCRPEAEDAKHTRQPETRDSETLAKWALRRIPAQSPFLELVPSQAVGLAECLIDLEGPRGKMRIQWKGDTAPDLAALSRILWESA
jgi:hypothetical protein